MLPEVISKYFQYKNAHNQVGLLSVFTDNAEVLDRGENKEISGKDQISEWINKSILGISLKTEISDYKQHQGFWLLNTIISGNFKASPAKFIYKVKIEGDLISLLDIEFAG